jgi:RNA polymerase sigma-70 factor, ECF subfamily
MRHRPFRFPRSRASIAAVDEQAFTTELERHRDGLHRHCVRMLGSRPDGDDALQETLLRAWRSRRTLSSGCSRAWLYRIATNACVDMLRRRDAVVVSLDDQTTEPSAPSDQRPDALLVSRETLELALLAAIQHLSAREQAAFVMRDLLSWSADEAAASLSTTVPAANSALQRARRRLRERLAPGRLDWTRAAPCAAERRTLDRYLSAIEARSAESAARLLAAA